MSEIRMHGRGGQGVVVGAEILSNALMYEGKYLAVFPSFGVERRGTDVTAFGRLSDKPVREKSKSYHPDYLMIFDPSLIEKPEVYEGFKPGGVIMACGTDVEKILQMGVRPSRILMVDGIKIAYEVTGNNLTNMILCGAFARATEEVDLQSVNRAIRENLPAGFVKNSLEGARRGFEEGSVYMYDVKVEEVKRTPLWERKVLSCQKPPVPSYEAPWGDYADHYITLPTGTWRVARPVINKDTCIRCGVCASYCPVQVIKKVGGDYVIDYDFCKGCGVCANECPKKCITMPFEFECASE